jgi:hypothetical protein
MKRVNVLIISVIVIALLAVPVCAQTFYDGSGSNTQPAATVTGFTPQTSYSNYFYFFNHGSSARSECSVGSCTETPYADGLWVSFPHSSSNFINLPITQVASYSGTHPKVRYATVQMRVNGGTKLYVDYLPIWNGGTFQEFVYVTWYTPSDTFQDFTLDLGSYYDMVRGMNMCLHVVNTDTTNPYRIVIGGYGAKAEW